MSDNIWLRRSGIDRQVGFQLRLASVAIWNDLKRTLVPLGLKPQSYAALLIVGNSPGCKQQDVADALSIKRPNLVALIDDLVTRGIIVRHVNPEDRRSYALRLSDAGVKLLGKAQETHRAHEERLAALVTQSDISALADLAKRLACL